MKKRAGRNGGPGPKIMKHVLAKFAAKMDALIVSYCAVYTTAVTLSVAVGQRMC